MKQSAGGRTLERDTRTRNGIVPALREAGFDDIGIVAFSDIPHAWKLPVPDRRTQVALFVTGASSMLETRDGGR
jgi:hypothetical protein